QRALSRAPRRRGHVLCYSSSPAPPPPPTYTLSLHDALPISPINIVGMPDPTIGQMPIIDGINAVTAAQWTSHSTLLGPLSLVGRSEEHTSELQSPYDLVCRLLLEKKNNRLQVRRRLSQRRRE